VLDGGWWRIATDNPDVSPFKIVEDHKSNVCDFTIYCDARGRWHLVACVRQTDAPGERVFHHWDSDSLTATNWPPRGLFQVERGTRGNPSAPTSVQAPHAFKVGDRWLMFYNSGGHAYCMISGDGLSWKQHRTGSGQITFFPMGRDVCLFKDEPHHRWLAYFCGDVTEAGRKLPAMVAREASQPEGPWSSDVTAVRTSGNPESPFVLRHQNRYYLWQQMAVYVSDNPLDFNGEIVAHLTGLWFNGKFAPEIIEHAGQFYVAGYGDGIWLARMKWVDKSPDELAAWRAKWEAYLKSERDKRKK
jgi:hypothetical protein